ncbi:putative bifunctional diguanylate cyclase/phosphodiesterase [Brumicola nitratireducens]|uniref:Diguanylate cyclase/phosphodiesterase n=1 Tax=Glaciecola nitratireducens (strain JCM 12485 / KCTC 12276 / FR1064) TaxID=1085623 RepID=G4QFJ5_GLANF|nr:EAL domain-containing protein [Glaciecola nitratireducens]AEP28620.1 diguanylate cyclase/phosphodiesterase [Glaciecola nitratireducens FR1064]
MIQIRGLLFKTLLLVIVVAILSLAASYGFVTAQQSIRFEEKMSSIKQSHLQATQLLFKQQLKEQVSKAQELFALGGLANRTPQEAAAYFEDVWPRVRLSFALSSMSISNDKQAFEFGDFPKEKTNSLRLDMLTDARPTSAIICHQVCELASSVPVPFWQDKWSLTLLSDIAPSIEFLYQIVGSDIGVLAPLEAPLTEQHNLKRYITEIMTGLERIDGVLNLQLTLDKIKQAETKGIVLSFGKQEFFIWFETISSAGSELKLIFVRDITSLVADQNQQKEQLIIIFMTVTLGILLTLITFSIIPISQINKLRRAIKLIANKEYNTARFRLGQARKRKFNDELHDLEDEFRNAIDMLELYEHELDVSQKRLLRQATIDGVTGLFTRNVLVDDLLYIRNKNASFNVAIFFLDLDGFKPVNDNLGHEAGDIMLKKIGYRLKGVANKFIKVYRIGGDEFVICYNDYSSQEALLQMAESIVQLFAAPFHVYETNIAISASIGIALQEAQAIDADQLLRYADIAMYQAKQEGKNRYKFFDESMRARTQLKFTIKNDFLSSLADGQLFLVYQPIVDSRTRKVVKIEALCRWKHPELGFIPPPTFIDVLEESENMNILFDWIVSKVVEEAVYLNSIGMQDIVISVNLSPSQLGDDRAVESLKDQLDKNKISPNRIELEITETTLITNFKQAKAWTEMAASIGFRVAIDDFGAGYSSLSYLAAFNYNTVKFDRSLLDKIDVDSRQQRIVGSLTQMIHSLSVPIVAEGAETEEQFEQLRKLGCDFIQGYLISKPITHEELAIFLQKHTQV